MDSLLEKCSWLGIECLMSLRGFTDLWDIHLWSPVMNPNAWEAGWSHAHQCKQPYQTPDWSFSKSTFAWREVNVDLDGFLEKDLSKAQTWEFWKILPNFLFFHLPIFHKQNCQEERQKNELGSEMWMPTQQLLPLFISLGSLPEDFPLSTISRLVGCHC